MNLEQAEIIGLKAVEWVAADRQLFSRIQNTTGMMAEDFLRLGEPEVLAAALDFVLSSDALVFSFCAVASLEPENVTRARQHLPGGDAPHWT